MSEKETTPKKAPAPKPKVNPGRPVTKADIAAQKRMDKMIIKRMRKR
ncbi:MAG TPA: hypothetical protein VHZ32_18205 [Rhizomicrobium sp.]|nr:hypothetical protein [Rhizomicrobium sp.]